MGSGHGLVEGGRAVMKDSQASNKIKLNTLLNGITKRGTAYSNAWGMLGTLKLGHLVSSSFLRSLNFTHAGMTYGVVNSGLIMMRGGSNDAVNAVGAGKWFVPYQTF